jgi:hypothetical protein
VLRSSHSPLLVSLLGVACEEYCGRSPGTSEKHVTPHRKMCVEGETRSTLLCFRHPFVTMEESKEKAQKELS